MDIIFDNIFLIILMIIGAISQWLKARADAKQNNVPDYDPADFEELLEEVERRQSRPAVPPPLPPFSLPQPNGGAVAAPPPLRRKSREAAQAAFDTSAELARQQELADKLKEMKRTRGARAVSKSLQPRKQTAAKTVATAGLSLKQRLGQRRELRQAFVLKEILDRPAGLR